MVVAQASFIDDLRSFRWMIRPCGAVVSWAILNAFHLPNPLTPCLFLSYPLPSEPRDDDVQRYGKGVKDLAFLAFYVVVFSFVRQAVVLYGVRPLAIKGGIKGERKLERFTEQGYAFFYWSIASVVGLIVMSRQPTWWYDTKAFWVDYPHWRMKGELKAYYLLQFSFWLQQLLVMVLRIEKPRSDWLEYCLHHIVTMWLIGWSYSLNLTYIGVTVFFSMDIADVFLALSKMLNYLKFQRTSEISFGFFLCVWTYFRHYQNIRILYSVWFEYDSYVPKEARVFDPLNGVALAGWMRHQVFAPILALQFLNLFWYILMWRIVYRIFTSSNAGDTREEGEDEDEEYAAPTNGESQKSK